MAHLPMRSRFQQTARLRDYAFRWSMVEPGNPIMIIQDDSLKTLKELEDSSIDFICTDPPYGYSFMGKEWDKAVPSVEIWQECLRLLKPGAFMNVMSAPRSDVLSRMIVRIEDAGFRVDFTPIYWTYASGFPKAHNIARVVDKKFGVLEHRGSAFNTAGTGKQDLAGKNGKSGMAYTEARTDESKQLKGSYGGFQPKPAVEVIIVAMKPLSEKTFVDQALKNGKGISWLDDCRVPTGEDTSLAKKNPHTGRGSTKEYTDIYSEYGATSYEIPQGRFPANLLVSDDVLNDGRIRTSTGGENNYKYEATAHFGGSQYDRLHYGDTGSYSRYFDLDKWASTLPFLIVPKASKSEKNKGLESFEEVLRSDGLSVITIGANNPRNRTGTPKKNHHPTVKPLKLMSYLITLFSREGDIVLDPFCGSGTTCVAAKELGREFIGIERDAEYVEIAKARLNAVEEPQPQLELV